MINNCRVSLSENKDGKKPIDISKGLEHTESIELVSDTTCLTIYMLTFQRADWLRAH